MTTHADRQSEWETARAAATADDQALILASQAIQEASTQGDQDGLQIARGQFEAALYDWGRSYAALRAATAALADVAAEEVAS